MGNPVRVPLQILNEVDRMAFFREVPPPNICRMRDSGALFEVPSAASTTLSCRCAVVRSRALTKGQPAVLCHSWSRWRAALKCKGITRSRLFVAQGFGRREPRGARSKLSMSPCRQSWTFPGLNCVWLIRVDFSKSQIWICVCQRSRLWPKLSPCWHWFSHWWSSLCTFWHP